MSSYVLVDRLQFAFTLTYHYLFPILTMGIAIFIAWLKTVSYPGREDHPFPLRRNVLCTHGATFLAWRAEGDFAARAAHTARRLLIVEVVGVVALGWPTYHVPTR